MIDLKCGIFPFDVLDIDLTLCNYSVEIDFSVREIICQKMDFEKWSPLSACRIYTRHFFSFVEFLSNVHLGFPDKIAHDDIRVENLNTNKQVIKWNIQWWIKWNIQLWYQGWKSKHKQARYKKEYSNSVTNDSKFSYNT